MPASSNEPSPWQAWPIADVAELVAHEHGGWLLREAGGDGIDGFGHALPNHELMRRVKDAFDPAGKFSPGRLPL